MKKLMFIVAAMAMFSCATQKKENGTEAEATTAAATQITNDITDKRWNLIEINGQAVTPSTTDVGGIEIVNNTAFIILRSEDNLVSASGGCNMMGGSFELQPEVMRISFSQMFSTQMACINENLDTELAQVLEITDNYSVSSDGKTLSLNRARMAPLARFSVE